jgi:hypothetical protein
VASISNGTISALSAGSATFTAASGPVRGAVTIVVTAAPTTPPPVTPPTTPTTPAPPSPAVLPQASVDISMPTAPTAGHVVISVAAGGDLQAAINQAQPGDAIELAAGATFTGNFTLPNKGSATDWIVIRPASGVALPPVGTRMTPQVANTAQLPKIVSPTNSNAIQTDLSAHHYRLVGLEVTAASSLTQSYGLIGLGADGSQGQRTEASIAHDLVLDRMYIHGNSTISLRRCVALNSARSAVVDSWIDDCHDSGSDAQAIGGWNGSGPFLIQNNRLEASTEIIMFGGSDPAVLNLVPSDITIRRNYLTRPLSWQGGQWQIKNIFELKNARRVLVEENVLEHCWTAAWDGTAVAMKSVNQDNTAPWSGTTDVTFRKNLIRDVGSGFNLAASPEAKPTVHMARVTISGNLLLNVKSTTYPGQGNGFFMGGDLADMTIDHNTVTWSGWGIAVNLDGADKFTNAKITNNIFATVAGVGLQGQNYGFAGASWAGFAPDGVLTGNVWAVGTPYSTGNYNSYPTGNLLLVSDDTAFGALGFINGAGGDVRLAATSPLRGKANDGGDPGADAAAVMATATLAINGTP